VNLENLIATNLHLNNMIISLDDIKGDQELHFLPNPYKIISRFKKGFNGTYQKVIDYEKQRRDLETKLKETNIKYEYSERRLYMYNFIKEPYSSRYPENNLIRFSFFLASHIELRYWINRNLEELFPIYKELKKSLGKNFILPFSRRGSLKKLTYSSAILLQPPVFSGHSFN